MIPIYRYEGAQQELLSFTYNGLTCNTHTAEDDFFYLRRVRPRTVIQTVSDDKPTGDGMEIYEPHKRSKAFRLVFDLAAPSRAALYDKLALIARKFDPVVIHRANASTFGFIPLDFSVPTEDTTNYATGLIPSRYYVRPMVGLEELPYAGSGLSLRCAIDLILRDPRRYLQSTSSQAGAGALSNAKGDYPSWPTVTITMSGAGSSTYEIENANDYYTRSLVLDLSGLSNGNVVTVDMEKREILVGSTVTMSLYVSGDYWEIAPGTNTISISNTSNTTTSTVYRPAFSL